MADSTARRITKWLVVTFLAVLMVWDMCVVWGLRDPSATISELTLQFFYHHPAAPFTLGGILGHITWPGRKNFSNLLTTIVVACSVVVLLVLDFTHAVPQTTPILPFLLGIPYGHVVWAQSPDTEKKVIKLS